MRFRFERLANNAILCPYELKFLLSAGLGVLCLLVLFSQNLLAAQVLNDSPVLSSSEQVANAGYFRLSWSAGADQTDPLIELHESKDPLFEHFSILYKGTDQASFISGKSDGDWYYRLHYFNSETPRFSQPIKVVVQHHPLQRALWFFVFGLLIFLSTLMLIVIGAKSKHE